MNSISTNPDLSSSFEELKRNARSKHDIAQWFESNPEVFAGIAGALGVVNVKVDVVEYLHYAREHAHNKDILEMTLSLKLGMRLQAPEFLSKYAVDVNKQDTVEITYGYPLELPLGEWAYATAVCTAIFIEEGGLVDTRPWLNDLEERLAGHMETHFPGIKMESFRAMEAAGLLPIYADGQIDTTSIIRLLFDSRGAGLEPHEKIPSNMVL